MWPKAGASFVLVLSLLAIPATAQASQKPGGACSKLGMTSSFLGSRYGCALSGKKLVWIKSAPASNAKLKQSITLPQIKTIDISNANFTGSFASSSKLPVVLISNSPLICSVKDLAISLLQTGSCLLSATQPGNAKYFPAQPTSYSFAIVPPVITSDNALFDEVQTFVKVPLTTVFSSDTAEISLVNYLNDATGKVCANDPAALGCSSVNGVGVADPASQTRYVEFNFHIKNLDANPLPSISYRLLVRGILSDIDTSVALDTLSNVDLQSGESVDGSFYGLVPIKEDISHGYLVIDEGITDSTVRLLMDLSH